MGCVMIGQLNGVAPFITMWFLTCERARSPDARGARAGVAHDAEAAYLS